MRLKNTIIVGIFGLLAAASTAQAFMEPKGTPLTTSSPAIVNTGPANQVKLGDLTVGNMKADKGINFSGEKRTSWLPTGAACAWEGWKCDCHSDGSSAAAISITLGVRCVGGRVEDARLFGLAISSKSKTCSASAPSPCAQALYTKENTDSGTFLEAASDGISSAAGAVGGFVVNRVQNTIDLVTGMVRVGIEVASAGVDIVVGTAQAAGGFVGDTWDAGKDMTREISRLAVDPTTNPIELVVGTGVAVVKAAATVVVAAAKTVVSVVSSVATGVVKAATTVVKALCFWC